MSNLACPAAFTCPAATVDRQGFGTSGHHQQRLATNGDAQRVAATGDGQKFSTIGDDQCLAAIGDRWRSAADGDRQALVSPSAGPAKDAPPPPIAADTLPTAAVKDTPPTAPHHVSSTPVIGRPPPSPKPAADYDGFSIGIVDDDDTPGPTTRPVRPRPAKQSKLSQQSDSVAGQQSVDQAEDEKLKRKLTICRGCK